MKILVSVDAEGIHGLTSGHQVTPGMRDYELARTAMARSVNAVARGVLKDGKHEVTAVDSHDGMRNIRASDLDSGIRLTSGFPRELSMVEGARNADKVFFLGYHPMAGSIHGIMDHTFSTSVHRLRINGEEMGEIGLSASVAGHLGVPVTFMAGDRAAVEEAQKLIEDCEFLSLKEGLSRYSATTPASGDAEALIEKHAMQAVRRKGKPVVIEGPVEVSLEFQNSGMADGCTILPGVQRKDGYTVSGEAPDIIAAYKLFRTMLSLASYDHGGY